MSRALVGRSAFKTVEITEAVVRAFAEAVDDHNPLHLDEAAGAASRFGTRVAHGMLVGSLFSGLIASELPGPGSIYVSQELRFRRPVPVGAAIRIELTCVAIEGGRAKLETIARDQDDVVLVSGEAVVLIPEPVIDA